jgi:maleate isomerase
MGPGIVAYARLVAIMAQGPNYHEQAERELSKAIASRGADVAVIFSAATLLGGIEALGARRVTVVARYFKPLTRSVVGYIEAAGRRVVDSASLGVSDNLAVGRLPAERVLQAARAVRLDGAEALVLSACVQMPSLDIIEQAEQETGLPVLTAAMATAYVLMRHLGLPTQVPRVGTLLNGAR